MRRLLGLLVVVLVVATACSGDDDGDLAATDRSTTTVAGLTADSAVDGSTTTVGGGSGAPAGTTAPGRQGPAATQAAPAPTSPPPPAAEGVTFAAPGRYTYRVTGTSNGRKFDTESVLTMDPPNGADQHSSQTSQQGKTEQTLRRQPDGVSFVRLTISAGFVTKEFIFNPPGLALPTPATIGRTWSWTVRSTDGATTVNTSFKVLRNETVDVGGQQVDTVVLEVVTKTSGDVTATLTSTTWAAPRLGLIVRTQDKGSSPVGTTESSSRLVSTRPA